MCVSLQECSKLIKSQAKSNLLAGKTKQKAGVAFYGHLFYSFLRLKAQNSQDKVPTQRLAEPLSWNNFGTTCVCGGMTSLIIFGGIRTIYKLKENIYLLFLGRWTVLHMPHFPQWWEVPGVAFCLVRLSLKEKRDSVPAVCSLCFICSYTIILVF